MSRLASLFRRGAKQLPNQPQGDALAASAREAWYWLQHPSVRERVNVLISGNRHVDTLGRLQEFMVDSGRALPFGRCASLGCGTGGLERDLMRRGMALEIDGYDPSAAAIAEATRLAEGLGAMRYHEADLAGLDLPAAQFDAVFSHGGLQSIHNLESVFAAAHRGLKPSGVLHLSEFVGASRFQWIDPQVQLINDFLDTLPERLLQTPAGRKPALARPALQHMTEDQPWIATRSSDIRAALLQRFDIVEERPFGGTLLHMGLADIAQNFDPANAEDMDHLQRFFDIEDQVLTNGMLGSDFTVLTAVPLPGVRDEARDGPANSVRPVLFGMSPTRQLRPPAGTSYPGVSLTVSKADTMLGTYDAHYLAVGQSAIDAVGRALGNREPRTILDLPCGFGRVTRALRARYPEAAITVSDLDRPGVDFSAREFGARAAYSVRDFRDLDLGETYDLIWVGSLMTHLPALQTTHLLAALRRHLSPDGVALVTLQGPGVIPRLRKMGYGLPLDRAAAVIDEYERTGFGYQDYDGGKDLYGVSLTNDNYGISLTDETWMRSALETCGMRLLAYEPRAWDDHHDIAVAGR